MNRIGPSRGANRNTSILGTNNTYPKYIPPISQAPISMPKPTPKTTIPLYTLSILDNHQLVSGDGLRRLVFFIYIDPRTMFSDVKFATYLWKRYPWTMKWNDRSHDDLEKLLRIFIVSDECIDTRVRHGIPNKAGHRHYTWRKMQILTDRGVLCCPCDKYSYTGLHDKLCTELYLYDIYLLCQHHSGR